MLLASSRWQGLVASDGPGDVVPGGGRGQRLGMALPDLSRWSSRRLERRLKDLDDGALPAGVDDGRLTAARRAATTALVTDDMAARAGVPRSRCTSAVEASAGALDRMAALADALDLARATGVAAHLAGENGFSFGRVHGLLSAQAASTARALRAERKALRRARRKG